MKAQLLVCAAFGTFLMATAMAGSTSPREVADANAKAQFLQLHFYTNNRGMHLSPGLMNVYEFLGDRFGKPQTESRFRHTWGFNVENGKPIGLFSVPTGNRNHTVAAVGCVACHSGRAAGIFIVGLGNKNIDVVRTGADVKEIEKIWRVLLPTSRLSPDEIESRDSAMQLADDLSQQSFGNLTQGLVPTAFVWRWFYRAAGGDLPARAHRGAVKVPSFWGYGPKKEIGQFSDGLGVGTLPGWGAGVEIAAGQTPDAVRGYVHKMEQAEKLLGDFLPPKYPRVADTARVERGRKVFENTCAKCHGAYERDSDGLPVYEKPKWVPISVVKTDSDRLDWKTEEAYRLLDNNPLNDIVRVQKLGTDGRGYFAPRLVAIWSRFPYLHNASVPSISALLTPPAQRPQVFDLRDAGEAHRFDEQTLGLTVPDSNSAAYQKLLERGKKGDREIYFTGREGQSNQGHAFGTALVPSDKTDLIEFLKTL